MTIWSVIFMAVAVVATAVAAYAAYSARRRERAAQLAAERSELIKNEFVSMVSHELRTPLTSIAGFASMLHETWQSLPPEEVAEFLGIVNTQSEHLSDLVEDILVIPRIETGRLPLDSTDVDLSELAHRVNGFTFTPGMSREASVAIPGGVLVRADPRRVQQVLRNLLENAKKFGGDQILVEGAFMGDHYMVVVSDNGSGVPDEEIDRIFRQFEQIGDGDSKIGSGTGLGLPIARELARAMGGDVWYERRFPMGSRFCYTIPVAPPAVAPGEESAEPASQDQEVPRFS
ncbi:MAG: HAMP domain-containing histidine kinase [Acidimicrobiia bacterium]|nr:HAMP domain-containing histidine kinase [Acidimicrobiia bacterium]